ncbi:MAG: DivIVA domain-containing protein [Mycoplasmoidaceae bacterium]
MNYKIKNMREEILNKKFRKDLKAGYDAYQVDVFFDTVLSYIKYLENENENAYNIRKNLESENIALRKQLEEIENKRFVAEHELSELKEDGYKNQKIIKDLSLWKATYTNTKNDK